MSPGPRVGVIVLDYGRAADAENAARSARDSDLDAEVLIVENGAGVEDAAPGRLRLADNRGFAGGMNAGIRRLLADGCERVLLLNNDAVLEEGCLRLLARALDDPSLAAVGPLLLRQADGLVESRGVEVDVSSGRVLLLAHRDPPEEGGRIVPVDAISGAVMMLSGAALARVGLLDESYFFSFEDVDWCLRARREGFAVGVVTAARARHAGSRSLGRSSSERLYYAARNHVRLVESHRPLGPIRSWLRRGAILGLNLAFALRQRELPRVAGALAVGAGFRDACRRRFGPRS